MLASLSTGSSMIRKRAGDGRRGLLVALEHREIDGHVDHARALRVVHAQEENIAPTAVGQIHAYRRAFDEHGVDAVGIRLLQLVTHSERMIERVAGAKHPAVAALRADRALHLLCQDVKTEP